MKKLVIDGPTIQKANLTIAEFFYMCMLQQRVPISEVEKGLLSKGFACKGYKGGVYTGLYQTNVGDQAVTDAFMVPSEEDFGESELLSLAKRLKALYPKGKKIGNTVWAESPQLIVKRLQAFFKKYPDDYNLEDIYTATNNYVESFNGDYKYMKTLRYFIFKEAIGAGGDREAESQLLNFLTDPQDVAPQTSIWTNTLI